MNPKKVNKLSLLFLVVMAAANVGWLLTDFGTPLNSLGFLVSVACGVVVYKLRRGDFNG